MQRYIYGIIREERMSGKKITSAGVVGGNDDAADRFIYFEPKFRCVCAF